MLAAIGVESVEDLFAEIPAGGGLPGAPVATWSVDDGPSAVGAAAYLARLANGRRRLVVSRGVHPHSRETLATMSAGYGAEVVDVPLRGGATDADALAAAVD